MTKHITLIVTGSVAAVKTFQLVEQLQRVGYDLDVIVTKAVWEHKFFESPKYKPTEAQMAWLKEHAIGEDDQPAIQAALGRSEKILVCPASADFISQIAHQNSPLGTELAQTKKPVFIAPAMNVMMWQHPAVVQNVAQLRRTTFLGPALGKMACGDQGYGRLAEIDAIVQGLETDNQNLFTQAKIEHSTLPQGIAKDAKNILLIAHHNDNDEAVACAKRLVEQGFHVECMLTPEARSAAEALQNITSNPPIWHHYQRDSQGMEHIRLPEQNDAVVIAPAAEKYLEEMACGASASLPGCAYLATKKPVIIMAKDSPHLPALKSHGATIVPDIEQLLTTLKGKTMENPSGKKILVFAGNPRERVDTFRFYVNDTVALAPTVAEIKELKNAGADVTVIAPASAKLKFTDIPVIDTLEGGKKIESARDMLATAELVAGKAQIDTVLQLAGVSSIACEKPVGSKIQKTGPDMAQLFDVVGNVDILARLNAIFPNTEIAGYNQYQEWQGSESYKPQASEQQNVVSEQALAAGRVGATRIGKLTGKRIIVTTARTEEMLTTAGDKITNFFSGRQGQEIAKACAELGADVTLISGPTNLPDVAHPNVKTIHIGSATQMYEAAQQALGQGADAFIGAAAVADFGAEQLANLRLKEGEVHTLALAENPSIVGGAAKHAKRPRVVVSFAAQSPETIQEYAAAKFKKLGVDLTVANPIGDATIASRDPSKNQVMLIDGNGVRQLPEMGKDEVAGKIADEVAMLLLKKKLSERDDRKTALG